MATISRENIGLLNDKLTVNLSKEDYMPSFEKSLKTYAKNANIPGFRKGMVPAGLVKKMYGQSVFTDEVLRTVEKELNNYVTSEKLDIFAQPLPFENDSRQLDMNNPGDYAFAFEIGLKPDIHINISELKGTFYKIQVEDSVVEDEVNRLRSRYGKMTEPETVSNEEDVLNVKFAEADAEGNAVEGGIEKDNSLLVKYFAPEVREQLMGKKKDDTILIQLNKAFEDKERDFVMEDLGLDKADAAAAEKFFSLTITKIGFVEKAELNEEFFKGIYPEGNVTNEEEFRNAVKADIQKYYDAQSSNQFQDQLYHQLVDHTPIEFPENFLKRWLEAGSEKAKTPEEAEKELPSFLNQLKWTLISSKLINENAITVERDEIKDYAIRQIASYMQGQSFGDMPWLDEYANRMLNDKKFVEETYMRLQTEKLFKLLEEKANKTEEPISLEAFEKKVHDHHH
ncbi:trigger factor [Parafilimonas sp.]|uniref:trigger factor n=1 Tax=Parafilimonas sp. TaxID=1969739 RepID=UPI0039E3223D